ncbi:MAG: glycosyltransferase family 2 protein [Lentisphaerae bacterium]|nr:glycosyltransferase family 2 protein [Lentisphaerota bacterium]MCP4103593.1 glycosyltransferase family 2 protein [Lentisphaerota bacterium]
MPILSIVVRARNDIKYIQRTLTAISSQNFKDFEIICFDSGSTDGTLEVIKSFKPSHLIEIKPEDYVPGKVLNHAVRLCKGKVVVFNNSDCIPKDSDWLSKLTEPLINDSTGKISATFCDQLARPDARPLVKKDHARAFGDGVISAYWHNFFSLASSAIPRQLLLDNPFDETLQYSEDIEWSWRMKKKLYYIKYVSDAKVEHSHNYRLKEVWERFYNEGLAEGQIYGNDSSSIKGFALPCVAEMLRDWKYLFIHGYALGVPYGIVYRFMQRYAVWKGRTDYLKSKAKI